MNHTYYAKHLSIESREGSRWVRSFIPSAGDLFERGLK